MTTCIKILHLFVEVVLKLVLGKALLDCPLTSMRNLNYKPRIPLFPTPCKIFTQH